MTLRNDREGVLARRHCLGLAAASPAPQLQQLQKITELAASHSDPESFRVQLVPGASSADLRARYDQLRSTVAAALQQLDKRDPDDLQVDRLTWEVASSLEVWAAEVEGTGRDAMRAMNRLADLAGNASAGSSTFDALMDLAETWGPRAGMVDVAMLRAELDRRGIALAADRGGRTAFAAVETNTRPTLTAAKERLAGRLHLPRQALRDAIASAGLSGAATLVAGRAGAGKSVLIRLAAQDLEQRGAVACLITLASGMTTADLQAELGGNLREALAAAPTGRPRLLVVDAAEQTLLDGGRLLRYVLRALPRPDQAPGWHLLVASRDEAAQAIEALIADELRERPSIVRVGDLSDAEVSEVLTAFPSLASIARHPRPSRLLLRRPYLVDLLVRSASGRIAGRLLGEEDVIDLVEHRLIRRADGAIPGLGTPAARMDVFLALSETAIAGLLPARLDGLDGEAREGLCLDDVILLDRHRYRFAHDVLADLGVTARLLEDDGAELVREASEPRRLLRAVRLWMQHRLADVAGDQQALWQRFDQCLAMSASLAAVDGERWESLPFEALLHAGSAPQLLAALEPRFLAEDGRLLGTLLDVALRLARPYPVAADNPIDVTLSAPPVELLGRLGARLPTRLRPAAAGLVRLHLAQLGPEGLRDQALLPDGSNLPSALLAWVDEDRDYHRGDDVLASLLLAAPYLRADAEAVLIERARHRPQEFGELVEDPAIVTAVAAHRPDLLLRLAGCYYVDRELSADPGGDVPVPRPRPRGMAFLAFHAEHAEHDDGVRDHTPRGTPLGGPVAGPRCGPFAALLDADSECGLRLVGALVDAATRGRIRVEAQYHLPVVKVELELRDGGGGAASVSRYRPRLEVVPAHERGSVSGHVRAHGLARVGPRPGSAQVAA